MNGLIQTMKTSSVASEMIEQMLAEALGSAVPWRRSGALLAQAAE